MSVHDTLIEWERVLRAFVVAGDLKCPGEGFAIVARKALADAGRPYDGPDFRCES